jgi:fucose 4-O-acetylase-like acetyltransferase
VHRATSRDPFFDNAKLLLVTLVVVGHSWTLFPDWSEDSPVYAFLYAWHVPAFVLVTGYLSRSFTYTRANVRKLLSTVVAPYLVFETLLALFRTAVGGEDMTTLYLDPHWPMWYLSVLFLWRLATPLLNRVPHPLALAVAVSLLGGVTSGDPLDVARALGLLPFFVIGLTVTREQLDRLAAPRVRALAAALMTAAFVAAVFAAPLVSKEWLYWRASYGELGVSFGQGVLLRAVMLVVAGGLALSALALVPRSQRWFTPLGSASLVVYLFHGFFVKAGEYAGVGGLLAWDPVTAFLLVTGAATGLALLLAATPVARRLNLLVDPISTVTADTPGVLEPHQQRLDVEQELELALTHRHPTRQI